MTPEIAQLVSACAWSPSSFLIFSNNVYAKLIYYSHIGTIIPVALIALFVFTAGKKELVNKLLVCIAAFFSLWVFSDLVLWATEIPSYTMFFWSLEILSEPLVYFFAFYFFYTFVFKVDFSVIKKTLFTIPLLPTFILAPTTLGLLGYDISNCDRAAVEGILATYGYAIEILYTLLIVGFAIFAWKRAKGSGTRTQIVLITAGITLFLMSFSAGNILEVFSLDWGVGQYGLFGAPVFVGFLAYLIVHYKAFNVRLIGAQVLVTALWLSVLSLLFIRTIADVHIVTALTLIFVLIAGILLVRGVYREIAQREHIEQLAGELQETNKKQETLMHFIGHEVKGFLTKDAGAFASLVDGDFGPLPDALKPFVEASLKQSRDGARSVTDILVASNQKKGTMTYAKEPFDLEGLIKEVVDKEQSLAKEKGLVLSFAADAAGEPYTVSGDKGKIGDNVFRNIIENSIYYTPTGSITASLRKAEGKCVFTITDTGVGISEEDKKNLFTEGGHGKESQKVNAHSTGYGLYIAKNVVDAHGGSIRAESEGAGKGATFTIELPAS